MSHAARIEPNNNSFKKTFPKSSSSVGDLSPKRSDSENYPRFSDLRGVQWRIDLGILPSSSSSTVDDFRRVTADSRRRYAALRRRLLINPHVSKDESNFRDHVMDNPLSQNPDSMWGRFFHKAELERMVDQDLSRLYPEHGSYFQTTGCQGVLRRVLLLWCIRYPNYGYRQGMHELLAPLLYVLQADLERLSEVRKLYPDYFTDNFDGLSFNETDLSFKSDFENDEDNIGIRKDEININYLDPKILTIISFSDAYGAEGELGIVLSEKFIEHDAYCMFDALMNGDGGAVAMANFFSHSPSPQNGLPPVIEASSALYHLLSIIDLSLYTHLVELGVEPQYFALRWLRVLFGREFALEYLLVIWDEIFSLDNNKLSDGSEKESEVAFRVLYSSRGAFISALAVSMILYLRSSLLATENATTCLQRLLNFPEDVNLGKLIKKARSLMDLAIDAISSAPEAIYGGGFYEPGKPRAHGHSRSVSSDVTAAVKRHGLVRESYWEEKWRDMNKEDDRKQVGLSKQVQNRIKGWSEKVKARLAKVARLPARRSLVDDRARLEENDKVASGTGVSEENYFVSSDPETPRGCANNINDNNYNNDHENETERSSVASNSSVNINNPGLDLGPSPNRSPSPNPSITSGMYGSTEDVGSPLPVSDAPEEDLSLKEVKTKDTNSKPVENLMDRSPLSGKFQWLWMFSKTGPEDSLDKSEPTTPYASDTNQRNAVPSSTADETSKPDAVDHSNLKNLAKSILENIEVIESVENLSTNTMEALKELRKISNLLSEM